MFKYIFAELWQDCDQMSKCPNVRAKYEPYREKKSVSCTVAPVSTVRRFRVKSDVPYRYYYTFVYVLFYK